MNLLTPETSKVLTYLLSLPLEAFQFLVDGNPYELALKFIFLLLPIMALATIYWMALVNLPTLIFRKNRTQFVANFLINTWDSGRAILNFWSGILKFIMLSIGWAYTGTKMIIIGLVQSLKDVLFAPITILSNIAKSYAMPGIPWVAVSITFGWILLEASIFTMVLSPMVSDILLNMANIELPTEILSLGLFVFLSLIIGGSLACMHDLVKSIQERKVASIAKMLTIETIVMLVEVIFFYREFVEAVLPFFNRMAPEGLDLSPVQIILIGCFAWMAIRSATWFLFAKYGTPTLLNLISREDINLITSDQQKFPIGKTSSWIKSLTKEVQSEINWFSDKGTEMTNAFLLPPIQILAVMTNLAMHTLTAKNLFNLPVKSLDEIKDSSELLEELNRSLKEA